ncbi:O-antigen ligase family protein [Aeromonas caviae]|uniref:O-antigen ligase family protein n=1 Tax=Aeromonas TaxID=642 RepID=UPI000DF79A3E|nr:MULTISPECIES: O-antigen ligase family protein [Aeromonas]MCR3930718.1 O-antigen ligase family protein [Aeromonas caviae]RDD48107.1 O-antigen ligase family protein [Aeromonas sp. ARM81]
MSLNTAFSGSSGSFRLSRERLLPLLVQLSAFLFGALALAIPSGYSYGPGLLLLASLCFFATKRLNWTLPRELKQIGAGLLLYFVVMAISVWWDGGKLSEIDRASRALMAAAMLPLLACVPVRLPMLLSGFGVGALIAGGIAIYDKFVLGYDRAFGDIMPLQSGNIAMSLGLFCLCGLFWAQKCGKFAFSLFMLLGTCGGMGASFLSGTRGGWVMLPLILLSIAMLFKERIYRKSSLIMTMGALLFCALLVVQPQSGVEARISLAQRDISQYLDKTNLNTSLGIRLQLWQSAWQSFTEKPLFGWGNHGILESRKAQLAHGEISQFIYNFNSHAHNQFLDDMAKRGVVGLTALLAMMLTPLILVRRRLSQPHNADIHCGVALTVVTVLSSIDYCLSQAFLGHNSGITFFVISLVLTSSIAFNESIRVRNAR